MNSYKTMKEVCEEVGMTYDALKYYCTEGLVPNHQRNKLNHRIFSENDVKWLKGLMCLKDCGMSIQDMKHYMGLCLEGESSIPRRKVLLDETRSELIEKRKIIDASLAFIDAKQIYYDDIVSGAIPYSSSLSAQGLSTIKES